jgi:hypothetical protein
LNKEDFNALIFRLTPGTRAYFSIKLNYTGASSSDSYSTLEKSIEKVKEQQEQFFPGNPFDYFFLSFFLIITITNIMQKKNSGPCLNYLPSWQLRLPA